MGNPVTPPDPYERYRIEAVERGRHEKGDRGGSGPPPEEKWRLAAYLLDLLHKTVSLLINAPREIFSKSDEKKVVTTLKDLKSIFEILKRENRSEDIQFLNFLSHVWQELLEESLSLQGDAPFATQFKSLVKKIQHFPEHQSHTFGYYLSEYAGQKWIPFPYMELIQKIHMDHQKSSTASTLSEWTRLIDELLLKIE